MLSIGETAPEFKLPAIAEDGTEIEISLSELRGKAVILYFYPKDDTPGCTTEALDFTRLAPEFAAAGAQVLGISKDTIAKHGKFCAKHALGIALLSDETGDTCERYGVWTEKNMYGKTYMGITRATFLIDGQGKIAQIWPKVKVAGHAEDVLTQAKALLAH
ncbi:thioredoxin-dependent thiol peroxidase [Albirhodobacter sp. R86504]|jgi:peroxiredoxin Q/BCP|uniref:thioredoxin-dependent thiol peroxidase n=1 Tax=Albirhodobacter sp. R86504 TaxID=3093848 RepID=UPI003670F2F8